MNEAGPQLRDIHLPADPSWWPPAPGWWLLAVIGLASLAAIVFWWRRHLARRRWRRLVFSELDAIAAAHSAKPDAQRLASEVSQLLRRASRLRDPSAPTLRGEAWLVFLDSVLGSDEFSNGPGRALLEGPYRPAAAFDTDALLELVRRWLSRVLEDGPAHA